MTAPVWEVEVDSATPAAWSEMLDQFNDANIYQTWSYGSVRWGAKNLSHIVVKRNGEVVGMAQLRIIRPTRLFGMAYLRWGPICERRGRPLDAEVFAYVSRALEEEYVEKRRLLLHVLPNAFAGSERGDLMQSAFSRYQPKQLTTAEAYRTFVVDLTPPVEELRKRLDKKWRNQLSRAERNNLEVVVGSGDAEFETFRVMYQEMRERKKFESSVAIDDFVEMQRHLTGSQRLRILICEDKGIPVAGVVASAIGDSAIYLLGATSDSGLNSKGAYLLHWKLMGALKNDGCTWYDLGGIDPMRNPGVYHFKQGFSGVEAVQVAPRVACKSALSSTVVNMSLALHRSIRRACGAFATRPTKPLAATS